MKIAASGWLDTGNTPENIGEVTAQVGVRLGAPDGVGGFDLFLAALKSRAAMPLLPDHDSLLRRIFAAEWDDQTKSWRTPTGAGFALHSLASRFFGRLPWTAPDDERLAQFIQGAVSVRGTSTPNVHELVITGVDPQLAAALLRNLHFAADKFVRLYELAKAEAEIPIIQRQIEKAPVAEQRQLLAARWLRLLTRRDLAKSDLPFAATIIEPPVIPARPVSPSISGVLLLALLSGLGAGFFLVLLRADNMAAS